ncbi:hypothetical protein [Rhodobacter amnigenus]|nr:hypothetical protein [Rhodobacter amnigenus]
MKNMSFTPGIGGVEHDFDELSLLDRRMIGCVAKPLDWDDFEF